MFIQISIKKDGQKISKLVNVDKIISVESDGAGVTVCYENGIVEQLDVSLSSFDALAKAKP